MLNFGLSNNTLTKKKGADLKSVPLNFTRVILPQAIFSPELPLARFLLYIFISPLSRYELNFDFMTFYGLFLILPLIFFYTSAKRNHISETIFSNYQPFFQIARLFRIFRIVLNQTHLFVYVILADKVCSRYRYHSYR